MVTRGIIEGWFPNIKGKDFKIFDSTNDFNCISYTLDIQDYWIWTNEPKWPYMLIPRSCGVEGFQKLYELHNYILCSSIFYEEGYDKISFYVKDGIPQHGCKQYGDKWRSKLGPSVIIEHDRDWLCGNTEDAYGEVSFTMKRKV